MIKRRHSCAANRMLNYMFPMVDWSIFQYCLNVYFKSDNKSNIIV